MIPFQFRPGTGPLVVSMPHVGTFIPPTIASQLTAHALTTPDTDWHLPLLYDFLDEFDATILIATHSRFVIDLNRPPDDANLYPGQDTTSLVPIDSSEKQLLYAHAAPSAEEIIARRETYWRPYHEQLLAALAATRARHGYALLWDAHSIKSVLPRYFPGTLTTLNIGTNDARACDSAMARSVHAVAQASPYSAALDARFKGGYITRHYGSPKHDIHALQLELSWASYMEEFSPYRLRDDLAAKVRPTLKAMMHAFVAAGRARYP